MQATHNPQTPESSNNSDADQESYSGDVPQRPSADASPGQGVVNKRAREPSPHVEHYLRNAETDGLQKTSSGGRESGRHSDSGSVSKVPASHGFEFSSPSAPMDNTTPDTLPDDLPTYEEAVAAPPYSFDSDADSDAELERQFATSARGALPPPDSAPVPEHPLITNVPQPAHQLKVINDMLNQRLMAGDIWYVISRRWLQQWREYCQKAKQAALNRPAGSSEADDEVLNIEGYPGPVDNRHLLVGGEGHELKRFEEPDTVLDYVPVNAWKTLVSW
jgi:hypothetical protein